ncbi:armadillo repeat-containing protein 5 isoform X1 [Bufo bufo]|uniref:armadillo repeat-containing protein 5 isoform X1 n=1 Tax=Bufo bufo TaxID=8384 RepID=UPI001ABE306A|nr:armadillo repeat-containing protein 5 isoform X1 [Bufo bufo]
MRCLCLGSVPVSVPMSCSSLSSCLSRLSAAVEDPAGLGRTLSELRSRHVTMAGGAVLFRRRGGLALLLALLTDPARAEVLGSSRRNLELALSLLANSCTEAGSRTQVRQLGGIPALVCILQSVCIDSIWNRVSRALGNLALDAHNNTIIHKSGAVSTLVQILQSSQDGGCVQSCLRALRIMGDSLAHRLSICQQGGLAPCVHMLTSPDPDVVCAAVRAVCELSRGCSLDCAEQLSLAVPTLVALANGGEVKAAVRLAALGTLSNLCNQGALRPLLGNAGTIELLIAEIKVLLETPARSFPLVRSLCLCCREALNRRRVRELGGLELLLDLLRKPLYRSVHHKITNAFLHYCHDTTALTILGSGGLAPLLAKRLEEVVWPAEEQGASYYTRAAADPEEDPGSASFDFPTEPKKSREEGGTSEQSMKAWLLSEEYFSSLDELPPDWLLEREIRDVSSGESSNRNPSDALGTLPSSPAKAPKPPGLEKRAPVTLTSFPFSHTQCQSPMQEILGSQWPLGPRSPLSEVLGPEFPVLLLLSRFSHLSDSSSLVSHPVLEGLLTYVTCHPQPSSRAARLLQRLTCDPSCLEAFIRTGSICTLRTRLLLSEWPEGDAAPRIRHPEKAKELGHALLRNLRIQAESPFGVGIITHMLVSGTTSERQQCTLCLPFINRNPSRHRQKLFGGALQLVLETLMCSVDPAYVFHASECLSSLSTPWDYSVPGTSPSLTSPKCYYLELLSRGQGDLVFVLDGGHRVEGNREVVSSKCDVFRAMLQGGYAESQQQEVHVREVPSCAFLPLLHYLHGCSQESLCPVLQGLRTVSGDELVQSPVAYTLAAAGRFLLPGLQSLLENSVRDCMLSLESLPFVYNFAETYESTQLRRDCCSYLLRRPHPPQKRAHALHQLCEKAQDKRQLSRLLEDLVQDEN